MESEQAQNFNERLSQWVSDQGFWFQVRYSMAGTGLRGRAMFHLLRMAARLLVFLLLAALVFWIYLVKRPDTDHFRTQFREDLKRGLSAAEIDLAFSRSQGQLEISRLGAEGGPNAFFTAFEARNIRFRMGLLDGLAGVWQPGVITITRLDADLRAGADDPAAAAGIAAAVFERSATTEINSFEVADSTLRWGYNDWTRGSIESSNMRVQRTEAGWRITFRGGRFSQNWLRGLGIVELVVLCTPQGLEFEKAELTQGSGRIDFSGLKVKAGERPELAGTAKIRNLDLHAVVPGTLRSFVEGSFSGDFRVGGSTNTSEGITFDGQVLMDGSDTVSVRDRVHILKALSVVDFSRNYHRIDFTSGAFSLKSGRGAVELSEIDLKSEDQFTLVGRLRVRPATEAEVAAAIQQGTGGSPLFQAADEADERRTVASESDFTLRRAALELRRIEDGEQRADSMTLFDRLGLGAQERMLRARLSERIARALRYEGNVVITIPGDAFERAARLRTLYPLDRSTGRIPIQVPIEGSIYEVTLRQAEDIYQQGQR